MQNHFYISHNWAEDGSNHLRAAQVASSLRALGYKVCFDGDGLSGDIASQIEAGIAKSEIVLCFITRVYLEKIDAATTKRDVDWCVYEFKAALIFHGRKHMMAIVMEQELTNQSNWFGPVKAAFAGSLFVNFANKDKLDQCVGDICREANARMDKTLGA